jgi:hypothetical protein
VRYPGAPQQNDGSRHHLTTPVNGGGAPLEVRTGSGNIDIDGNQDHAAVERNSIEVQGAVDCSVNCVAR